MGIIVILGMDFVFHSFLFGVHTDLSPVLDCRFIFHRTMNEGVECVVSTYTYVIAGENAGSPLADQNGTGQHLLPGVSLNTQTFGVAIAPTTRATATLLMCH